MAVMSNTKTIPMEELLNWNVFRFLSPDNERILQEAKLAHVFGNTGIIVTRNDDVYSVGQVSGTTCASVDLTMVDELCGIRLKEFVAGSKDFCLGLTCDGAVYSWGDNKEGQLGIGKLGEYKIPRRIEGKLEEKKIVQLAASDSHVLAVTDNGKVYSWGGNKNGELGLGHRISKDLPSSIQMSHFDCEEDDEEIEIVSVAVCGKFSFALGVSGQVFKWGGGSDLPCKVAIPATIKKIIAARKRLFGLSISGVVYCLSTAKPENVSRAYNVREYVVDIAADPKTDICVLQYYDGVRVDGEIGGEEGDSLNTTLFTTMDQAFAVFCQPQLTYRTLKPVVGTFVPVLNGRTVGENIRKLWLDQTKSDVTFSIEDKTIIANKTVLSSRSSYFDKMFGEGEWKDIDNNNAIVVEGTEFSTFESLLYYIYHGALNFPLTCYVKLFGLLKLADAYGERGIARRCESILMRSVDENNLLFILQNAGLANALDLEQRAINFVLDHANMILTFRNPGDLQSLLGPVVHEKLTIAALHKLQGMKCSAMR